ncbi:hypothetical protein DMH17_13325 [Raoultella planticola]|nr:hypothetical protein [Raoultella planticola]
MAVNKMDSVDFSEETFNRIREEYLSFAEQLPGDVDIRFVPLSALEGTTSRLQSASMPWYSGPTLLEVLKLLKFVAWWKISRCASRSSSLTGPTSTSAVFRDRGLR